MSRPSLQNVICYGLLALIFLVSLVLRIAVPWDQVFSGNWVKFTDNDAYFYVRLLDNLSQHFPSLSNFDPYYIYPDGGQFSGRPFFFVYLMGFIAWVAGAGSPSQHIVDLVAVYFPAVLGALLVYPVFFIGRSVFNKWAGLIAAGFAALMPGEFLVRTLLGNTDSHVLEIFLSTFFLLFLLLSARSARGPSFYPWRIEYRGRLTKSAIYGVLAGLCLGLYLLAWPGALLFVFISFTWLVLQCVSNHLRGQTPDWTCLACFTAYLAATIMVLIWLPNPLTVLALAAGLATAASLPLLSYYLRNRGINRAYYAATVICLGMAAALLVYAISPHMYAGVVGAITGFFTWQTAAPISEMQPLLLQQGSFTLALVWGNYTAASVMALVALAFIIYRAIKRGEPDMVLLAVWSLIILLATLAMRRFAYYLAINVALLAGYTGWLILKIFRVKEEATTALLPRTTVRKKAARLKAKNTHGRSLIPALGIALVTALVVYPNTGPLPGGDRPFFDVATKALFAPGNAWCESLDWLRNNTPEPFGDAGYYYARYGADNSTGPAASYSTLCWWDYGYWVSRIGRRVPCSNPGSSDRGDWRHFMARTPETADNICSSWKVRYVIVNDHMINCSSGFRAVAGAAGEPLARYYEVYYRQQDGNLLPTPLYYPEYYRTMTSRLYCFDGKEYKPQETAVVSWEAKTGLDGSAYKEITGLKTFGNYVEAETFISAQKTGNWRIVGKDPLVSPVPLEALDGYKLAFSSSQKARVGNSQAPEVKIFEYIR